jgi:hypothetical protein
LIDLLLSKDEVPDVACLETGASGAAGAVLLVAEFFGQGDNIFGEQ